MTNDFSDLKLQLFSVKDAFSEPQTQVPDLLVWMISNGERVAYFKAPIHHFLFHKRNPGHACNKFRSIQLHVTSLNFLNSSTGSICNIYFKHLDKLDPMIYDISDGYYGYKVTSTVFEQLINFTSVPRKQRRQDGLSPQMFWLVWNRGGVLELRHSF